LRQIKRRLLDIIAARVQGYRDVEVSSDLVKSLRDGKVLSALIHSCDATAIDMEQVHASTAVQNLNRAFHLLESRFGVPMLLQPSALADASQPIDERTLITFLSAALRSLSNHVAKCPAHSSASVNAASASEALAAEAKAGGLVDADRLVDLIAELARYRRALAQVRGRMPQWADPTAAHEEKDLLSLVERHDGVSAEVASALVRDNYAALTHAVTQCVRTACEVCSLFPRAQESVLRTASLLLSATDGHLARRGGERGEHEDPLESVRAVHSALNELGGALHSALGEHRTVLESSLRAVNTLHTAKARLLAQESATYSDQALDEAGGKRLLDGVRARFDTVRTLWESEQRNEDLPAMANCILKLTHAVATYAPLEGQHAKSLLYTCSESIDACIDVVTFTANASMRSSAVLSLADESASCMGDMLALLGEAIRESGEDRLQRLGALNHALSSVERSRAHNHAFSEAAQTVADRDLLAQDDPVAESAVDVFAKIKENAVQLLELQQDSVADYESIGTLFEMVSLYGRQLARQLHATSSERAGATHVADALHFCGSALHSWMEVSRTHELDLSSVPAMVAMREPLKSSCAALQSLLNVSKKEIEDGLKSAAVATSNEQDLALEHIVGELREAAKRMVEPNPPQRPQASVDLDEYLQVVHSSVQEKQASLLERYGWVGDAGGVQLFSVGLSCALFAHHDTVIL
jgi:Calponin homology (CH) domain